MPLGATITTSTLAGKDLPERGNEKIGTDMREGMRLLL